MLSNDLKLSDEERLRMAGAHLEQLKALGLKGPDYDLLRAIWLGQSGKLEESAELLKPLVARIPLAALQRFEIDLRLNRMDEARDDARALRTHFAETQRRGETLTTEQYRAWAQAELLLQNTSDWARIVREWLKLDPTNAAARMSVAQLDTMEFNDILKSTHPDANELAERLLEIARISDKPETLEPQVASLYKARHTVPAIDEMMRQLIASSDAPMQLVASLGTAAALDGDIVTARQLLERVIAADDKNAVALNNLAWVMSQDPGKDLNRALESVNRALELMPSEFRFRETRGQVLVSLGRWKEAIDDLEFALNGMPDAKPIHIALATAYENLGDKALAEIHRKQAQ
jgi:tetratricopeptide (TPR) repeat protein